ncbi:MAG TPA: cell surface protein SprA, partial [Bacteroidota bacterium]|nr:cell surface protein SprA [Bacteroidota bacterium]
DKETRLKIVGTQSSDAALEVWVSSVTTSITDINTRRLVNAYAYLPPRADVDSIVAPFNTTPTNDLISAGTAFTGYMTKLTPDKYQVDVYSGYIALKDNIDNLAVAVAYRTSGPAPGTVGGTTYGQFAASTKDTSLTLKLLKPAWTLLPTTLPAWNLQMKNVYHIGQGLSPTGFKFEIFYRPPGAPDTKYLNSVNMLQVTGVDRYTVNSTGAATPPPDEIFDFLPGITVNTQGGDVIFPVLHPFGDGIKNFFASKGGTVSDSLLFNEIYTLSRNDLNNITKNFYYMNVTSSATQQSRISLGSFNIVEGSVQVTLNGQALIANTDYSVDYIVGEVDIKNPLALAPGANLQITYEQNDLFQLASKTLVGARAEVGDAQTANLGMTIMSLNQSSLSDKVRLGEEPNENTMMGIDGGLNENLPFLTDALAAIPFLKARDMSTFSFHGEGAMDDPNPNTRTSTVASDDGASVAYIDDFEGAKRTIPLNVLFSGWTLASPPSYMPYVFPQLPDSEKTYSKARLQWYNNSTNYRPVSSIQIWPNRQVRAQDQFVSTMILDYNPNHRGMYNFSPNLDSSLHRDGGKFPDANARSHNWNGVMKYIGTTAGDLVSQNISYLEIWVNTQSANMEDLRKGKLFVDLGRVSEDVIPNFVLNSEDIIKTPGNPLGLPTGRVQTGADLGLDMLGDDQERVQYSDFYQRNKGDVDLPNNNDLSGDDYVYTAGDTNFVSANGSFNGTEGNYNGGSPAGRFPDTEDLNGNGALDPDNSYLEYEIPLDSTYYDSTRTRQYTNNYLIGGNAPTRWFQLRIPLTAPARTISPNGSADNTSILQNVQYVRFWLSGFAEPVKVSIAEMDLVGNQWIQGIQGDSVMKISVVNIEDNPGYQSPPGVQRPLDRTDPSQVIQGNEQSLALIVNNLPRGQSREADKISTSRPIDMFSYKQMKMFVHGDPSFQYFDSTHYDAEVYLRFGLDQNNYYECRQPIVQTPTGWFEMDVDFSRLTVVKADRNQDTSIHLDSLYRLRGTPYGIKGQPALNNIVYIGIGVVNPEAPKGRGLLSGTVWVNELRVVGA